MFKDEIKEILLPQIEIPKLKGHTKIELTDVHTGKKEVIEHDNAFTDGLQSFCRTLGSAGLANFRFSSWSDRELWKVLLGGIYLFDTAIPNNAKYMPAGTQMVANSFFGASNGGNPTELGTYNANESFSDDNTINLVYDWLTSQGNGTISAVSLGTAMGGRMGYGNATSKSALSRVYPYDNQNFQASAFLRDTYFIIAISNHGKEIYTLYAKNVGTSTTTISVNHYKTTGTNEIDIFRKRSNSSNYLLKETITIELPAGRSSTYCFRGYADITKTKMYGVPNTTIANGATMTWYEVDILTGNVTTHTFTNNTGETITQNSNWGAAFFILDDTYALVYTSTGKFFKINYTNNAVIGETQKNGATLYVSSGERICKLTDTLFTNLNGGGHIYDIVKNEFLPCNSTMRTSDQDCDIYSAEDDCMYYCYSEQIILYLNPLRLMTINNLDTPVEKTASKTMKVTYTITRATT